MGLDQYAHARRPGVEDFSPVTCDVEEVEQLAYWRKHPNLQGWMEKLWNEKGGGGSDHSPCGKGVFSLVGVELTATDLDALERAVRGSELPETHGIFFGSGSDEEYADQDLEFIRKARKALEDGNEVVYSSWW